MKFGAPKMAGRERTSADPGARPGIERRRTLVLAAALLLASGFALGQVLYKYPADDGSWIYADRPPADTVVAEIRELPTGSKPPVVTVQTSLVARNIRFTAFNAYPIPVEVVLALDALHNVELPRSDQALRWVLAPGSRRILLELAATADNLVPDVEFRYLWFPGDPDSEHVPDKPYRAPFAVAREFPVTQAYPMANTHNTADSRYAVDFAMPIGTDIYAARSGVVFEVASSNFRGGLDTEQFAAGANLVRIMHDDGTHAVYAHLNWNTIRVWPGDRVLRGEYIADSGNTGYSSGPHLHFAVLQNKGMRLESVPLVFEGPNLSEIVPLSGNVLAAY
jgi:murein DD-endopeptidase MepM/ murein hydrolase activator NlpD